MSLLAFLGGRHNKRAWAQALFAAGCKLPAKPDAKRYAALTEQIINADCKAIRDSARIIEASKSPSARSKRKMIMLSRYNQLLKLKPYATFQQRSTIRKMKGVIRKAKRYR